MAADAWWRRALEIDPMNTRAKECLRLLSKSSSRGIDPSGDGLSMDIPRLDDGLNTGDIDFDSESSSENMAVLTAGEDGEPSVPRSAPVSDDIAMRLESSRDVDARGMSQGRYSPSARRTGDLPPSQRTARGFGDGGQVLPSHGSRDLSPPRGSRDLSPPRGSRDLSPSRGSRDLPPSNESRGLPSSFRSREIPPSLRSGDLPPSYRSRDLPPALGSQAAEPGSRDLRGSRDVSGRSSRPRTSPDAFDFAATGQQDYPTFSPTPARIDPSAPLTPWDEGPSRTKALTIDDDSGEYDAVPHQTPLPDFDRQEFFSRRATDTKDEIMNYLRSTGDLPLERSAPEPSSPPVGAGSDSPDPETGGIPIEEPVEIEPSDPALRARAGGPEAVLAEGRRRYQLHDFGGAIDVLETMPPSAPEIGEARNLIASCRNQMLKMYESKIGDFDQTPHVLISSEEVIWLNLNHRAGFILSQIDGTVTFDDIISLSGMPRLDTVRILTQLLKDGVIGVR